MIYIKYTNGIQWYTTATEDKSNDINISMQLIGWYTSNIQMGIKTIATNYTILVYLCSQGDTTLVEMTLHNSAPNTVCFSQWGIQYVSRSNAHNIKTYQSGKCSKFCQA